MYTFYELKSQKWKQPLNTVYRKTVFINRSWIFIALPKFYARHLDVKTAGPEATQSYCTTPQLVMCCEANIKCIVVLRG